VSVTFEDATFQAKVFLRQHQTRIKPDDWIRIAEQTRQHFNRDRAQELVADITGSGVSIYTLNGIVAGWVNKFSLIREVEFPAGEQSPIILPRDKYTLYRPDNTDEQLKFLFTSPSAAQTIRLNYTVPHDFSKTASTIEDNDKMLVSLLMAHYAALVAGADFLNVNRSNLANDSSNFSQKYTDITDLSDKLLAKYADMLAGGTEGQKTFASINKDYDMIASYGQEYLIHERDNR